ncbi:MAG: VWA containing CoxE family protein [Candidatus Hodarchaeota archaeon]
MSRFDTRETLINVFTRSRQSGFILGVGELLSALHAVDGGWGGNNVEELKQVGRLLWCNSPEEEYEFEDLWTSVTSSLSTSISSGKEPELSSSPVPTVRTPSLAGKSRPSLPPTFKPTSAAQKPTTTWEALPVRVPFMPIFIEDTPEFHAYWPVSRRFMVYAWRYLRRPIADGPEDILDVNATVQETAERGFYLTPVYRRREINHAHLILMLDQGGSMVPFHSFTRNVVETAQYESNIKQVDVFYFHNVPTANVWLDPYMTTPFRTEEALAQCSSDSSVLVVSDAGSARGHRRLDRIRATTEFVFKLRQYTRLSAWLNPMPADRWLNTSAQIIAHFIPMFQVDPDDFSNAIDIVRGQELQRSP